MTTLRQQLISLGSSILVGVGSYAVYYAYNYNELFYLRDYDEKKKIEPYQPSKELRIRVINLDNSLLKQKTLIEKYKPQIIDLTKLGPGLRMDSSFILFWEYERALTRAFQSSTDDDPRMRPLVTFYGSNDFHHLALPLIRRFRQPFNLVLFDNHPDWFRGYPGLHCGCWFTQAASLPTVRQAFHFGGASGEFEEKWGFHPWEQLKSGKIAVFPTHHNWEGLQWDKVSVNTLRSKWNQPITEENVRALLEPHKEILGQYPLYITLDKDCMMKPHNYQNWNSGNMSREETMIIIRVLLEYSKGRLLAIDVTGEFSPVELVGTYRHYLHKEQHDDAQNLQDPDKARETNERTNMKLLSTLHKCLGIEKHNTTTTNTTTNTNTTTTNTTQQSPL